jgi:hypothetical protein
MAVIGFTLLVLGNSPSWFNPLVSALGITVDWKLDLSIIGVTKKPAEGAVPTGNPQRAHENTSIASREIKDSGI